LGYDYGEWWSFEGALGIAPNLDENFRNSYGERISILYENAGVHSTWALRPSLDALFHFTRWERLDPFLTLGVGFVWYGDEIENDSNFDTSVRGGGGVMYHFNNEWALRADARTFIIGEDTEANLTLDAGVVWNWGAGVPYDINAQNGFIDSDGDRLSDTKEGEIGTDPYNADTDGDKLSDGDEVLDFKTDPLNADTDWDGLKDGAEVHIHKTDPNDRDTDDGGVADGHEVLDDFTDPLDPSDDLQLIELYIPFDYDKAVIKPEYFDKLDIVAKVLKRDSKSTAVIEGHADRKAKSDKAYNQKLSERRAKAVLNYLVKDGIAANRLKAKGFGFSRPKAPNDPKAGNPINRRVEVYIRKGSAGSAAKAVAPVTQPKAKAAVQNPEDK
jgi:outer membrane protein OmpA-like peptidoglycan-associated protein